ncbi:unnamed protein product [Closterium sp. Yama58-4]|nr:unnamed protein product [Closterium sp. Yama58-4]
MYKYIGEQVDRVRIEFRSGTVGLKAQVEAARREAADAAVALKAELARMKDAAERHAAEVAYVRATAEHTEARMNDLELAMAEWKSAQEKTRAEEGRAGSKQERRRPRGRSGSGMMRGRRRRVDQLEKSGIDRGRLWEVLLTLWARTAPQLQAAMDLSRISCLSDAALSRLASFRQLTTVTLEDSSGFTAAGVRQLYSLPELVHLDLTGSCTDAALEGIDHVTSLRALALENSEVTDLGEGRLEGLTALIELHLGGCESVTSAGMVHVGKLTALQELSLHKGGVREDGLLHLTNLISLNYLTLPPGVTDSGMKYLKSMKLLVTLGLWGAKSPLLMAMAGGMAQMLSAVPEKVRPGEVAGGMARETATGGMEARVEQLVAAKLAQQEEAMAVLKREMDEMKRAMAKAEAAKGAAAKGALERGSIGETAKGKGGAESAAAGEAGAGLPAQLFVRRNIVPPGPRGGRVKAEIARMRAAAERHAAELAYVRATAAHTEARMNEVELAVAEWKSAQEKARAEMDRAEDGAGAEKPEEKKRKREEAGKAEEMEYAAAVGGGALFANRVASDGKCDEGDIKAAMSAAVDGLETAVDGLLGRVVTLEESSIDRGRVWEVLLTLWSRTAPQQQATMDLSRISCLSDAALTRLASFRHLKTLNLGNSSGFTAAGVRQLYCLPELMHLNLTGSCTDAALEGIDRVTSLRALSLDKSQELALHKGGVREDGLMHLTGLTSLNYLILPPGVTDSGMKYLRNMKLLMSLGLWDAKITARGVSWLEGLPCLQMIATEVEVEGFIQDAFPEIVVTPGPLRRVAIA